MGARLLTTSTSEVYGDPEVHPQSEDYWGRVNPVGPRSCYDEGKRVAESLCYAYAKQASSDQEDILACFFSWPFQDVFAFVPFILAFVST